MALTEPHAGSSLSDAATRARPEGDHHLLRGSKIFISGGDHDLGENIVHAVLARVDGAPTGSKGLSLFLVPKRRPAGGTLVPNDVHVAGLIHKIGWRGLPSVILSLGEADACHGWLLGEEGRGLAYMFQLINEARLAVGVTATSTASVAYQESLAYAQERRQGRAVGADPHGPQVPIIEHADVRRMLLRQKAIVEGAQGLVLRAARSADLARNALTREERDRAQLLLDLLIPVVKAFAAERGYEANALALQIHGGYGYSSELPLEAWLRDQKLNSIHEGTTGIQGLDLLGRRALAGKGAALAALELEGEATCARAAAAGVDPAWTESVRRVRRELTAVTAELAAHGARGDPRRMLRRSAEYLELFSTWAVAWQWLEHSAAAAEARASGARPEAFCDGQLAAARYWMSAELPRAEHLLALCRSDDDGLAALPAESF